MARYNIYEGLLQLQEETKLEAFSLLKYIKKPNSEFELQDVHPDFIPSLEIASATIDRWSKTLKQKPEVYSKLRAFSIPVWWIVYLHKSFLDGAYVAWKEYSSIMEIEILRDYGDMEMNIKLYKYVEDYYVVYPICISYSFYTGIEEASCKSEYTVPSWAVTKVIEGNKNK